MTINQKNISAYLIFLSAILFSPSKTILGLVSSVEIAILIVLSLIAYKSKSIKWEYPDFRLLLLAVAIVFSFLSFLIKKSSIEDISYIIRQIEYLIIAYLFYSFAGRETLSAIKKAFIISLLLLFIWSVLQITFPSIITIFNWGPQWKDMYVKGDIIRVFSLLDNPLSFLGVLVVILGLFQFIQIKFKLIYLSIIYLMIISTASKIGFIIVILSMIIQLIISLKSNYKVKKPVIIGVFAIALSAIVLLIVLSGSGLYKRITNEKNLSGSIGQRELVMKSSLEMLSDNWFWGIGSGNFEKVYLNGYKHDDASSASSSFTAENFFIDYYLYNGLIPTLILLFIFISLIYRSFKSKSKWQQGIALSIVYFLVTGLVTSLRSVPINIFLFSLIGIQLKLERQDINTQLEE